MTALLVAPVLLPLLGALVAAAAGGRRPATAGRAAGLTAAAGLAAAIALVVSVAVGGPVSAVIETGDGRPIAGLSGDAVTATLIALVLGVSTIAQGFGRRYLRGDVRAARFFALSSLLTGATAAMAGAATLIGLAVAWTIAGAAVCLLLGLYRGLPSADEGVRRTRRAFLVSDLALWGAVAVATATWGQLDLRDPAAVAGAAGGAALTIVATLLVVAAIARSAQLPLHGWLPATLAAPTPVSAMLHAGVVNAGGILLVRLAPVFGASATATHLAFAVGAVTLAYGTVLMLAKPDVKGALVHSTTAQMGFMVMTCGLGAYAAAVFHIAAHGLYKSALFLGSGGAVSSQVRARKAPPPRPLTARTQALTVIAAAAIPAAALAGAPWLLHPQVVDKGGAALVIFAWATGAAATWGWLRRHPTAPGALAAVAGIGAAAFAYLGLLRLVSGYLAPALSDAGAASVEAWALAPVAAVLAAPLLARVPAIRRRCRGLVDGLYVHALAAGDPATGWAWRRPSRHAPAWRPAMPMIARSEGGRS